MMIRRIVMVLSVVVMSAGCAKHGGGNFGEDVAFLKGHSDVVVLSNGEAQVAVVPQWQGRVMTSTGGGNKGNSYGWINYELIESKQVRPHINVFGGEDRFWMGPEGGQYAIFFRKGDTFDLDHWQTPAVIDTDAYQVTAQNAREVAVRKVAAVTNFSGTKFEVRIDRSVRLLSKADMASLLGVSPVKGVKSVGFESENTITNIGERSWTKDKGLLSIWVLGMFKPSAGTTVVAPYQPGPVELMGPVVNDNYFAKVPADRLIVDRDVVYFKGDGQFRSKIGFSPKRAKSVMGSYDAQAKVLTIVQFKKPDAVSDYVNSAWAMQVKPYGGDVTNSYNDGPPAPGAKPLGPFYELETSSPAAALTLGESLTHFHRTFHFEGNAKDLDVIARAVLGVGLEKIEGAFAK